MKKYAVILVVVLLAFLALGCGKVAPSGASAPTQSSAAQTSWDSGQTVPCGKASFTVPQGFKAKRVNVSAGSNNIWINDNDAYLDAVTVEYPQQPSQLSWPEEGWQLAQKGQVSGYKCTVWQHASMAPNPPFIIIFIEDTPEGTIEVSSIPRRSCDSIPNINNVIAEEVAQSFNIPGGPVAGQPIVVEAKMDATTFTPPAPTATSPPATVNSPKMSMAEFDAIQSGMTYEQVVQIVGGPGEKLSESGSPGEEYYTVVYMWEGEGTLGANANCMFQAGALVNKAQLGLE